MKLQIVLRQTAAFVVLLACGFLSLATSDCTEYESRAAALAVTFAEGQTEARLALDFDGDFVLLTVEDRVTVHSLAGPLDSAPYDSSADPVRDLGDLPGEMGGSGPGMGGELLEPSAPPAQPPGQFDHSSCESKAQSRSLQLQSNGADQTLVCWNPQDGKVVRLVRSDDSKRTVQVTAEVFENVDHCKGEFALGIWLEQQK